MTPTLHGPRWSTAMVRLVVGLAVVLVWEVVVRAGFLNPFWISAPSLIAAKAWQLLLSGQLALHVRVTLVETVLGLVTGAVLGIAIGVALGVVPAARRVLEPYVIVLNAFPKIALAPLYLVWFGVAITLKVAMAFSLVVFVMILGTSAGFVSVQQAWIDHVRALGASRAALVRRVIIPAIVPWIYASFQLSVGFALMGAVLGEFIATQAGVGYLIDEGVGMFDTATVFVGLLTLLLLALLLNGATEFLARRLRIVRVHGLGGQVL